MRQLPTLIPNNFLSIDLLIYQMIISFPECYLVGAQQLVFALGGVFRPWLSFPRNHIRSKVHTCWFGSWRQFLQFSFGRLILFTPSFLNTSFSFSKFRKRKKDKMWSNLNWKKSGIISSRSQIRFNLRRVVRFAPEWLRRLRALLYLTTASCLNPAHGYTHTHTHTRECVWLSGCLWLLPDLSPKTSGILSAFYHTTPNLCFTLEFCLGSFYQGLCSLFLCDKE